VLKTQALDKGRSRHKIHPRVYTAAQDIIMSGEKQAIEASTETRQSVDSGNADSAPETAAEASYAEIPIADTKEVAAKLGLLEDEGDSTPNYDADFGYSGFFPAEVPHDVIEETAGENAANISEKNIKEGALALKEGAMEAEQTPQNVAAAVRQNADPGKEEDPGENAAKSGDAQASSTENEPEAGQDGPMNDDTEAEGSDDEFYDDIESDIKSPPRMVRMFT